MHTFEQLISNFATYFDRAHFAAEPRNLYEPNEYFLSLGGKRVRPILCLMANEMFGDIHPDAYKAGAAIELFHNFTLVHDDIMDNAPLRRGKQTVHTRYNQNTAILSGDVMLIKAYEYLSSIDVSFLQQVFPLFNRTATEVCEGQQWDVDFEKMQDVRFEDYLHMITQKTSVLLAASLRMGGILGGSSAGNLDLLYQAGINMGLAFQIQDDYLDAFGNEATFGKQIGGDILANKKTFLLIHALQVATGAQQEKLHYLLNTQEPGKVAAMLELYKECNVDAWALELKEHYLKLCLQNIDDIAVVSKRKAPLQQLAVQLISRQN